MRALILTTALLGFSFLIGAVPTNSQSELVQRTEESTTTLEHLTAKHGSPLPTVVCSEESDNISTCPPHVDKGPQEDTDVVIQDKSSLDTRSLGVQQGRGLLYSSVYEEQLTRRLQTTVFQMRTGYTYRVEIMADVEIVSVIRRHSGGVGVDDSAYDNPIPVNDIITTMEHRATRNEFCQYYITHRSAGATGMIAVSEHWVA